MVVVIIIAITAAIAIPNMSGWFGKKNLDSISLQMFSDFQRARSEAITRGRTVTIQINKAGGWYEIHDSTNSQIVPQTTMLKNTTIAKVDGFPLKCKHFRYKLSGFYNNPERLCHDQLHISLGSEK